MAAIALTAAKKGGAGIRALLGPILVADVPVRYYAFAIFYMVTVKLAAAMLHRAILGAWPAFETASVALMPFAVAFSTPFQAGEEIGWRGYALPRLAARMGLGRASLVLGAIWALWHLPQFYIADGDSYHQSFLAWAPQVVAVSVAMAWLYARTGSLLLVMLLHAAVNNTRDIVPAAVTPAPGVFSIQASSVSWLGLLVAWLIAAVLLVRMPHAIKEPSTPSSS